MTARGQRGERDWGTLCCKGEEEQEQGTRGPRAWKEGHRSSPKPGEDGSPHPGHTDLQLPIGHNCEVVPECCF